MEKIYEGIGLMSGTSLDGLDIAYCRFVKKKGWSYELLEAKTVLYSDSWINRLSEATMLQGEKLIELDAELGRWMAKEVKSFIHSHELKPQFIASHGHTVFHQPEKGFTLQIGNPYEIHIKTGCPLVYNFRSLDIAHGGQGAPLVPVGDHFLFNEYQACLNLGGIANISMVSKDQRIAYDIAPANMPINYLANQVGESFDENGKIAATGVVNKKLFDQLNTLDYYKKRGSKSLGFEWISANIYPLLKSSNLTIPDLMATISEHVGYQVGKKLPKGKILTTGGGVYNSYLMNQIKKYASEKTEIIIPDKDIVEFKEAIIFSFLGLLRLRNEINCFKNVTGASSDSSSGSVIGTFGSN